MCRAPGVGSGRTMGNMRAVDCRVACWLREVGSGEVVVGARAVGGLFGPAVARGGAREITLREVSEGRRLPGQLPDAELALLDDDGAVLGAYAVGAPAVVGAGDGRDLRLRCLFHRYPHPAAGAVWESWARAFPPAPGGWAAGGPAVRAAWLEAARLHAATPRGRRAERVGGTYDLDGRHVTDRAALYCALGEALGGPAGYYGANLDALADCLTGGFGPRPPFRLRWHHPAVAREHLEPAYLDAALTTLADAGVAVDPSPGRPGPA